MTMFPVTIRLMLLLMLVCASLCLAAVIIGRQRQSSEIDLSQYGFATCDLPCWAGITPGETTAGFIIPLLERHIPVYQDARFPEGGIVLFHLSNDISGNVRFYEAVNQIYVMNLEIPVLYLIDRLSLPDCVNADGNAMLLMWYRDGSAIISTFLGNPVQMLAREDTTATGILIFEANDNFCQDYAEWRGFAPLWFYQQKSMER
jgi:hypothetical protein